MASRVSQESPRPLWRFCVPLVTRDSPEWGSHVVPRSRKYVRLKTAGSQRIRTDGAHSVERLMVGCRIGDFSRRNSVRLDRSAVACPPYTAQCE